MKKLIAMALTVLTAGFVLADEEVTMVEKEITTVTVPFGTSRPIRTWCASRRSPIRRSA